MIEHSENISELAVALLNAQKAIGRALKSAENPYFKSKYADLTVVIDSIKEPLNDNDITFMQAINVNNEGNPIVDTILLHSSGQYLSTRTPVFCSKPNDPQAFGSGITYSKRYALQAILGLPTEDDDAESAVTRNTKPSKKITKVEKEIEEVTTQSLDKAAEAKIKQDKLLRLIYDKIMQGIPSNSNIVVDMAMLKKFIIDKHGKLPTKESSIDRVVLEVQSEDLSSVCKENDFPGDNIKGLEDA